MNPKEEVKKTEEKPGTKEKTEVKVPEKFKDLVSKIEGLSVLELSELVKILEDKFGVSAQAPVMMAAQGAAADGGEKAEEKSDFNLELTEVGPNKIQVIKAIKEIRSEE